MIKINNKIKKSGGTNLLLVIKAILNNEASTNHKVLSLVKLFERQKANLSEAPETKKILELQNQAYEDGRLAGYEEGFDEGYQEGYDTCYQEASSLGFDMATVAQFMADGGKIENIVDDEIDEGVVSEAVIVSPYNKDVF